MSRICDVCGKGPIVITPRKLLRGNWNPTTKQRKFPNLQTLHVQGKKIKACTNCLRTLKKDVAKQKQAQE